MEVCKDGAFKTAAAVFVSSRLVKYFLLFVVDLVRGDWDYSHLGAERVRLYDV